MRKRTLIPALVVLLIAAWSASSAAETVQDGNLRVSFSADFAPRSLPRDKAVPVEVRGRIATTDGSHPPPLRWFEVKLNRNGRLYSKGLPVCTAPQLQSTDTATALARCRGALVGRGNFRAQVLLEEEILASGKILAFNSRRGGKPALLLHLFAGAPVRFALVVPMAIEHRRGQFGTVLRAKVPRLGGNLGSVTEIGLTIDRRYSFRGKRRSYVSAACSAPGTFTEAVFPFARGSFRFEGHRKVTETLLRTCRVSGS